MGGQTGKALLNSVGGNFEKTFIGLHGLKSIWPSNLEILIVAI